MKSCDELKQQSCCNSLSLCHSHTVTLVCDELLGGLPSQRGSPSLPRHRADTRRRALTANALMSVSRLPPVSASSRLQQTSHTLRVFINMCSPACASPLCIWFMHQTDTMDACTSGIPLSASSVMYVTPDHFHVVVRRSRGYPETRRDHHLFWEQWSLQAVSDPRQHHINTVHAVLTGSCVCTDEPEQPGKPATTVPLLEMILYIQHHGSAAQHRTDWETAN